MRDLKPTDFTGFFNEIHGFTPFPWQEKLAAAVAEQGAWPNVIDLPTASGKTSCIDIALFALAARKGDAPRRIFFVVDRRVIVDEAHQRANKIANALANSNANSVCAEVARRLAELGGDESRPLMTTVLRGGTYRDEMWLRSPRQPSVIASTVDQVGSRLLFRGYGMRATAWPLHAGMIANDALIFLDEAHCSGAFAETLQRIESYRGKDWTEQQIARPFSFVQMTATPKGKAAKRTGITNDDREHPVFRERLTARKPVKIAIPAPGKTEDLPKLAKQLVQEAKDLATETNAKRIAIMVNRIETARLAFEQLGAEATLVIGRMRPLDRDTLRDQALNPIMVGKPRDEVTRYVVSTQCLEVGADVDFDVIVSECASIDALVQRFGRLDRIGKWKNARGAIVVGDWQLKEDKPDIIYGDSLRLTWNWLQQQSVRGIVEMGVERTDQQQPETIPERLRDNPDVRTNLSMERGPSAALLPAHLDCLVQTGPPPRVEPAVEIFLHGKRAGAADVNVVWRGDLDKDGLQWARLLALCPPCSAEALPAQFGRVRRWLSDGSRAAENDVEADIEGAASDAIGDEERDRRRRSKRAKVVAFVWRDGKDWTRLNWARDLRPGDTVVLRVQDGGWEEFGHVPPNARRDVGDEARFQLLRRAYLRLHPSLLQSHWPECEERTALLETLSREDLGWPELAETLSAYPENLVPPSHMKILQAALRKENEEPSRDKPFWANKELHPHPLGLGYILTGWLSQEKKKKSGPVSLAKHTKDVMSCAGKLTDGTLPENLRPAVMRAAEWHDAGKVDPRFQAWLRGGDTLAARIAAVPLAKSGRALPLKQVEMNLPAGFRHELLSLLFAEKLFNSDDAERDVILHLVASHHGVCRPFAPVITEKDPSLVQCAEWSGVKVCQSERLARVPHRLDSGVPERFWKLTRKFGWWGLAYLEGLLRLADWEASSAEYEEATE